MKLISEIKVERIFSMLPENIKKKTNSTDLNELDASKDQKLARKRFFRLKKSNIYDVHITYGYNLDEVYRNSKSFHKSYPQLSCKPIFLSGEGEIKLFGQEFFDGKPIDLAFNEGTIKEIDTCQIIENIFNILSEKIEPSTNKAAKEEFRNFKKNVLLNKDFKEVDRKTLTSFIFPKIETKLLTDPPTIRWSSGDLSARNILVNDKSKTFKIIDCEFAYHTHFYEEDWFRLKSFSTGKFNNFEFLRKKIESLNPVWETYLRLRQTILNRFVHTSDSYSIYASDDLIRSLNALDIHHESSDDKEPLIIRGFHHAQTHYRNQLHEERSRYELLDEKRLTEKQKLSRELNFKQLLLEQEIEEKEKILISLNNEREKTNFLNKELELQKIAFANKNRQLEDEVLSEKQKNIEKTSIIISKNAMLVDIKHQLILANDKISRIQHSFSWRITSFLRFIRRLLIDRFKCIKHEVFDPKIFLELNPDLKERFGNNLDDARRYFELYGKQEERSFSAILPPHPNPRTYQDWINLYDKDQTKTSEYFTLKEVEFDEPLFSIVMPVFNPPKNFFREAIQSVINQNFDNWELCIADDMSSELYVKTILEEFSQNDSRIKIHYNTEHSHISVTSNNALNLARGRFVVLMDHDDLLRPHTLQRLASVIASDQNAKIIYSDEDKIDEKGNRSCPYFKPDWNPDLLLAQNYLCHLFCAETELFKKVGGFRKGFEGSQDWDLILRLTEIVEPKNIKHVPEVLYHWRIHSGSVADNIDNKNYAVKAASKAVSEHLSRNNVSAKVTITQKQFLRVNRQIRSQKQPRASIIIPSKDNFKTLKKCVKSVFEKTASELFQLIVIDNQTTDHETLDYYSEINDFPNCSVLKYQKVFNYSAINNFAVKHAQNDILVFLNDDTEVISKEWLNELISQASRTEIGAVGAKLFYPDGSIQHAGIILGYCKVAGEIMKGLPGDHPGQMQRANLVHNVSAVTGACLAVEKKKFIKINGFDEHNLKVAFNDVDLCLRLMEEGFYNLYTPFASLHHHESKTRGKEDTPEKINRFESEIQYMLNRWSEILPNDPNYNPNLSLNWNEQFELAFPPRKSIV